MLCRVCEGYKLSKEFVFSNFSTECEHPPLFCMRCAMEAVHSTKVCPYPGCSQQISSSTEEIREYETILKSMFPEPGEEVTEVGALEAVGGESILSVVLLTGEAQYFPFTQHTTVLELKQEIQSKFKVPLEQQKLLYNEEALEEYRVNGIPYRLADYSVQAGSKLYLLILLYSVPKNFNHVVFDLYWNYPSGGCDYLDASCLAFSGTSHHGTCDFNRRVKLNSSVVHSGDVMNHQLRRGHHTIDVKLQQIPSHITHLVFTLSAWESPTIRHFPNPSLKFFEASNRNKDLCSTSFSHAVHSQAVVMCSVVRGSSGGWNIYRSGKTSAGNAMEYEPLIQTIQGLIKSGM